MTQDELTLVLEALKWCHGGEPCGTAEAIAVVEKALAQQDVQYTGNGTAGRETDVKPTGFFFQMLKPEQEPWCMKMSGCKTKCEDCPDKPLQPEQEEYLSKAYRLANELRCHLAIAPAPQRTWVGLTDEEIDLIDEATWDEDHKSWGIHDFARAIEAKLKEKNT